MHTKLNELPLRKGMSDLKRRFLLISDFYFIYFYI